MKDKKFVSGYVRGRAREGGFVRRMWGKGWFALRCFRSAGGAPSAKVKPIDVITSKIISIPCPKCGKKIDSTKLLFIQISKHYKDISNDERVELVRLSKIAGADAILAYKVGNKWEFSKLREE